MAFNVSSGPVSNAENAHHEENPGEDLRVSPLAFQHRPSHSDPSHSNTDDGEPEDATTLFQSLMARFQQQ